MSKDFKADWAPLSSKRATYMDTTAVLMDKDPTEELTIYCESFFNVKMENVTEASAAIDLWQNSWTARARQAKSPQKFYTQSQQFQKREKQRRRLTEKPPEALAEIWTERCKNFQVDEGLTKVAAVLLPKKLWNNIQTVSPIACLTAMRKLVGYLWLMTLGKLKCESSQTVFL